MNEKILEEFDKRFSFVTLDGELVYEKIRAFISKSLSDQREALKAELIEEVNKIDGATEDWREVFISIIKGK